jgi:hypothetical protein
LQPSSFLTVAGLPPALHHDTVFVVVEESELAKRRDAIEIRKVRHDPLRKVGTSIPVLGGGSVSFLGLVAPSDRLVELLGVHDAVALQVGGEAREELIDIFVSMPDRKEAHGDALEVATMDQIPQVSEHVLALALFGGVVELQVEAVGQLAIALQLGSQGVVDRLDGNIRSLLEVLEVRGASPCTSVPIR